MTPAELLGIFRIEVQDVELPYLWSDALAYGYMDDAQKQFCRLTYGIEDARSFKLSVTATKIWYDLDPLILQVRRAENNATGREVPLVPYEKLHVYGYRFDGSTGEPRALVTGLERRSLRLYPVPTEALTINLFTFRLPEEITTAGAGEFEIDDQHHRNLLAWVKYRAYDVQDAEVYDKTKAQMFKAQFEQYCFEAKKEQSRLNRPLGAVVYGGI